MLLQRIYTLCACSALIAACASEDPARTSGSSVNTQPVAAAPAAAPVDPAPAAPVDPATAAPVDPPAAAPVDPAPVAPPAAPGVPAPPAAPGVPAPVAPVEPAPVAPVEPAPVAPAPPAAPIVPPTPGQAIPNPFAADWAQLNTINSTEAAARLNQCMGLNEEGNPASGYRTFTPDDPNANPKTGDICNPQGGNTPQSNGACNVPCGFERQGAQIGNKNCTCNGQVFNSCGCRLLDGVPLAVPTVCSFPNFQEGLTDANGDILTYAKQMDETVCTAEFATCITQDLPPTEGGSCAWTTPKGCICLENELGGLIWQCASTNSWFACDDANGNCPASFAENGVANGDLKAWCSAL